jgi:hypothetical protein
MTSYANISIVIPQCSSSSFRSLRNHPTTLYRDASGSKGKAKVLIKKSVCWLRRKKVEWKSDELCSPDYHGLDSGRPTDLHWRTDAAMPTIHIHSRKSQRPGFLPTYSLYPAVMPAHLVFYSSITIILHFITILHRIISISALLPSIQCRQNSIALQLFTYTLHTSRIFNHILST